MPDSPITLVRWRRADTDPPTRGVRVLAWTPQHPRAPVFAYRSSLDDKYKMWSEPHDTLYPQPTWWCDPVPPGDDPLTVKHLWKLHRLAEQEAAASVYAYERAQSTVLAARFRRAIKEVDDA